MKYYAKRCLAAALAAAVGFTMFPSSAAKAAGEQKTGTASREIAVEAMASFDFNTAAQDGKFTSKDVVASIEGNGSAALQDRDAQNGKALYLDGSAGWLSLKKSDGTSLLTGMEEFTISFDAKPDRTATNWGFYAAPNEDTQKYQQEHYIGAFINGGNTKIERYHNNGGRPGCPAADTGNGWSHVDVVFTEDSTALYVNGTLPVTEGSSYKVSDILGNNSIFLIGKANWENGEYYKGWIDNFTIYNQALEVGQICTPETLGAAVQADKEKLSIQQRAEGSFTLPIKGAKGSEISWVSQDTGCITIEDGRAVVKRPQDADKTVTLTATISMGGVSDTKDFAVTVVKELEDSVIVDRALEKVSIPNQQDVRDNISLPSEIAVDGTEKKAQVSWTSSRPEVISAEKVGNKEAGIVTRPEPGKGDVKVTLQAEVSSGAVKRKADPIEVTVKEKRKQEKMTSYLFAHFTGTEGSATDEQIYFATSEDGSQWMDMTANGSPALVSEIGEKGVRDPYLIRSHNGDKFYLIATDLSIYYRGGWGNAHATVDGSTSLVVWESTDLVNWTEPRLVDVASRIPKAGMAWAPEAYYDPDTGNYVVYWATASEISNERGDVTNMYYATTRDFYTFSEPVLWIDREHSIIDTTMIYDDTTNKYYRASGDGQITIEQSDSIYEGWEIIGTLSGIFNNNDYSGAQLEGPEFFEYCEDDWLKDADGNPVRTWGLMCDQYARGRGYLPFRTTNLADMSTESWSPATDVNFGGLKKRHGTILPISDAEYKAVMKKFGYELNDDTEEKILVDFDFNEETDLGSGKKGFASEYAQASGGYALQDSYNEEAGKALYLDGSASNFLSVTDKEGKSILSGVSEMTISYEFKPDRSDTNWVAYAAPNATAPVYNSERYLGILANSGTTTVERYNNGGSRPTNPSVQTGSDWSRVDIVITKKDTTVYLNGKKEATVASAIQLPAILGNSSILQIGKANWENGEYCKGWIDNFRIKNRASSEAEIQELAEKFVNTLPAVSSAVVGTAPTRDEALDYRGTDYHTAITSTIDQAKKEIQPYVRKGVHLAEVPVSFGLTGNVTIQVDGQTVQNGAKLDLTRDLAVAFVRDGKAESWTVKKPVVCNNPALPGQYADPDIDYFDGKFWIYPTTDGYPSWSGDVFHAFSSEDMVNWEDEGIIMKLADQNPGVNDKGIQIANSPWAVKGSAWAPTIEKKNGKYYFYYCGKDSSGTSSIGVAVADKPEGPYTDKGTALVTAAMCREVGVSMGQAIDPSIYTEDDGTSYILFGNGSAAIAELNDDMTSIKDGTLKQINGLTDFRESVIVTKKDGVYHWTWTCDDANSPNYHVNYGVSDTLLQADGTARVTMKKRNLLSKDESKGILGSGHQSVLHVQDGSGKDRYFMAYHRFYTPLNIFTSSDGLGVHRETCIDEITFDRNGEMVVTPTLEGVAAVEMESQPKPPAEVAVTNVSLNKNTLTLTVKKSEKLTATVAPANATDKSLTWKSDNTKVASVAQDGTVTAKAKGTATISATAKNGKSASCKVTVKEATIAVKSVKLNIKKATLGVKEKLSLKATVAPSNATNKKVTWKSDKPNTVSVTSKGKVTAKKTGKAKITASAGGKKATCTITVKAAPKRISLNATKKTLKKGKTYKLKVKLPKNTASYKITYSSSKKKVASVSSTGKIKALKKGTATITAKTFNGKKAKIKITVR
ncbi:family 43 glycosylhydrolase [Lachnospiraceae bacterium 29-84]